MKLFRLSTLLLLFTSYSTCYAQFSYIPDQAKREEVRSFVIPRAAGGNFDISGFDESSRQLTEVEKLQRFLELTEDEYGRIKRDVGSFADVEELREKLKKLSERKRNIYLIHENFDKIKQIGYDYKTNFRKAQAFEPQAVGGLNIVNNDLSDTNGILELAGRINNTRLSLPTKLTYKIDTVGTDLVATRFQRDRYLYFDFISRGLLATDSLQRTISEYINTTQGSPLSIRMNFQKKLSKPENDIRLTERREPTMFVSLNVDARAIPVTNSTKLEEIGGSFHLITNFSGVFPSGKINSDDQEDNFIIQFSFNMGYVTDNVKSAIMAESGSNTLENNLVTSIELRVGNFSEVDPARNWSVFAKYTNENIIGNNFALGFSFAPRGGKQEETPDS